MKTSNFATMAALVMAMLACSLGSTGKGQPASVEELRAGFEGLPAGDAARGEQIFLAQPCHTCHADLSVGPALPGDPPLAVRAETRRPGYSADLYLYESMVAPNAYVVPGFQQDIMPPEISETLTEQDLADLVAYLMTMK